MNEIVSDHQGPVASLFPSHQRQAEIDRWLSNELALVSRDLPNGRVTPPLSWCSSSIDFGKFNFKQPQQLEDVLSWTLQQMTEGIVQISHPGYFGLFNPAPTYPAQCAERIVSLFNPQLASATTSPFPVLLEAHVIRAIALRAEMPLETVGHFTSGGSEANATAAICALSHASPDFASKGARAFAGQPTIYISTESHLAWVKIAHQTGIGRHAVRLVTTDGHGRMSSGSLRRMIAEDLSGGCIPVMIVSTAGTTGGGMVDPIETNANVAREYHAWHHVDAAWAGALICSDNHKPALQGLASADSVTIDAHKWFATSMGCGMFLTAHPEMLQKSFQVSMDCMPSNTSGIDPYATSLQWSRRFLGLRLFFNLAAAGWSGYGAYVERSIKLSNMLVRLLEPSGWTCINNSPCAVLCLRPPAGGADPQQICKKVVASGYAWISTVLFEGERVIRVCITNGTTGEQEVKHLAEQLSHYTLQESISDRHL